MTVLLIDVGNTALKWTTLEEPDNPRTIVHEGKTHFKDELFEEWNRLGPTRIIGCSVAAPSIAFSLTKYFNSHGYAWEWVNSQPVFECREFTLVNGYARARQLGADRWFAAVGAISLGLETPLLVVHTGTATTVDSIALESPGAYRFIGGRIAPGPTLMKKALMRDIPTLNTEMSEYRDFPERTSEAIMTGIVDAQVGLIERAREKMSACGPTPRTILAGGAARWLAPHVDAAIGDLTIRHNLVLRGLVEKAKAELKD